MKLTRYLRPQQICMELRTRTPDPLPDGWTRERLIAHTREAVLRELIPYFEASGRVVNPSKLFTDLLNRERKAPTAIGEGIAIPHVRTMQVRDLVLVFARSPQGVEFGATDSAPVRLFFGVVAPPYDDRVYLQVYRRIGQVMIRPGARRAFLEAASEHEVIRLLSDTAAWDFL